MSLKIAKLTNRVARKIILQLCTVAENGYGLFRASFGNLKSKVTEKSYELRSLTKSLFDESSPIKILLKR